MFKQIAPKPVVWSILLAAVALLMLTTSAQAAAGGCRSDPVLLLSDLTVVDLSASIDTDISNVNSVTYTFHAPRGVKLLAAVNTSIFGNKEVIRYYDDNPSNTYTSDTVVDTTINKVGVTATTLIGLRSKSVSGLSRHDLSVTISTWLLSIL